MDNRLKRMIMEANEISQYLKKDYVFESDSELNSSSVKIVSKSLQIESLLPVNLFKDKLVVLRKLMYEDPSDSNSKKADQLIRQACLEISKQSSSSPVSSADHPTKEEQHATSTPVNDHSNNYNVTTNLGKVNSKENKINFNLNKAENTPNTSYSTSKSNAFSDLQNISSKETSLSSNNIQMVNSSTESNHNSKIESYNLGSHEHERASNSKLSLNNNNNVNQSNKSPTLKSAAINNSTPAVKNNNNIFNTAATISSGSFDDNCVNKLLVDEEELMNRAPLIDYIPQKCPRTKSLKSYKLMNRQFMSSDSNINIMHCNSNNDDVNYNKTRTTTTKTTTPSNRTTSAEEKLMKSATSNFRNASNNKHDTNNYDINNNLQLTDNQQSLLQKTNNDSRLRNIRKQDGSLNREFYKACEMFTSKLLQQDVKLVDMHDRALNSCNFILAYVSCLQSLQSQGLSPMNEQMNMQPCMNAICQLNILDFLVPHIFKHHPTHPHHSQQQQLDAHSHSTMRSSNSSLNHSCFNDSNKHSDTLSDDNDGNSIGSADNDVDSLNEQKIVFSDLLQGFSMLWKVMSLDKQRADVGEQQNDDDDGDDEEEDGEDERKRCRTDFSKFNFEKLKNLLHYMIQNIGRRMINNNNILTHNVDHNKDVEDISRWSELSQDTMNWLLVGCDDALLKKVETSSFFIGKQLDDLLECVSTLMNDERVNKPKVTLTQNIHQLLNIILQLIALVKQIQMEMQKLLLSSSSLETMMRRSTSSSSSFSSSSHLVYRYVNRVATIFNHLTSTVSDIHSFCPSFIKSISDVDMTILTTKRILKCINQLDLSSSSLATSCYGNIDADDVDDEVDGGGLENNFFEILSQEQVEVLQEMHKLLESCIDQLKNSLQSCASFGVSDGIMPSSKFNKQQSFSQQSQQQNYMSPYGVSMSQQPNMSKQQQLLSCSTTTTFNKLSFKRALPATPQEIMKQQYQQLQQQKQFQTNQQLHYSPPTQQQQYSSTQHLVSNRDTNEPTSVTSRKIQKHYSFNQSDAVAGSRLLNYNNNLSTKPSISNNESHKPSNISNDNKQSTRNMTGRKFSDFSGSSKLNYISSKTASNQNLSTFADDFNNNVNNGDSEDNTAADSNVPIFRKKASNNIQRYYANRHSYMQ
ncbi:hypothetical protein HELRODRAFT_166085 [Helobdella robusta]|uniref:Uncharacterized protein n=1 Tax=Helobdella robusta TaxID=6412 RepID=T1EXQ5_HELRO|nr:hypothetical protein HELRODRAFT_166085 [Helobdella robusta]ESN90419.1 hypothetical protein HELRODRAFT_166085 [Helobdella robusta]